MPDNAGCVEMALFGTISAGIPDSEEAESREGERVVGVRRASREPPARMVEGEVEGKRVGRRAGRWEMDLGTGLLAGFEGRSRLAGGIPGGRIGLRDAAGEGLRARPQRCQEERRGCW